MNVRLIILQENKEPISLIAQRTDDFNFLFSESFINGKIDEAIENTHKKGVFQSKKLLHNNTLLAPEKYGMTIINLKTNTIDYLNDISKIPFLTLFSWLNKLDDSNVSNKLLLQATKENKLSIFDMKNNISYSIEEFFGTKDLKKIDQLMNSKVRQMTLKGAISNLYRRVKITPSFR